MIDATPVMIDADSLASRALIPIPLHLWARLPNSTYATLFLGYSMTSVRYGTNWSKKQQEDKVLTFLSIFSGRFVIFTLPCIKVPMLPQLHSLPRVISIPFWTIRLHIHCVTSPVIAQTRPPMLFLLLFNPVIHSMPRLTTLTLTISPFQVKSRMGESSQDPLRHLIR